MVSPSILTGRRAASSPVNQYMKVMSDKILDALKILWN